MYWKFRTHRSMPSRLNAVGPKKYIGCSLVRKKLRISEMPFNARACSRTDHTGAALSWAAGECTIRVGPSLCRRSLMLDGSGADSAGEDDSSATGPPPEYICRPATAQALSNCAQAA